MSVTIYDVSQYAENRGLTQNGIRYVPTVPEDDFFGFSSAYRDNDTPINAAQVEAGFYPHRKDGIVFPDIEIWDTRTAEDRAQSNPKYIQAFQIGSATCEGLIVPYIPRPDWYEVARKVIDPTYNTTTTYASQMAWEQGMADIHAVCDGVVRSVYYVTKDTYDEATNRAIHELRMRYCAEADALHGKPVYWYISHKHASTVSDGLAMTSDEFAWYLDNLSGYEGTWAIWESALTGSVYPQFVIEQLLAYAGPVEVHDFADNALADPPINQTATVVPSNYLICQKSGFRVSVLEGLVKDWRGIWSRKADYDPRHPQDFVRAKPETAKKGSVSPEPADVFVDNTVEVVADYTNILTEDGALIVTEGGKEIISE